MPILARTDEELAERQARWRHTTNIQASDHWGLVAFVAKKFVPYEDWGHLEDTEEFADGLLGLHQAMLAFDPGKGFQFSTFATWCIRNEIIKWRKYRYTHTHGETVRFSEAEWGSGQEFIIPDYRAAPVNYVEIQQEVKDILELLPADTESQRIDRQVFIDWYLHGRKLKEIAQDHINSLTGTPVGRERIRQRKERAMDLLRQRLGILQPV